MGFRGGAPKERIRVAAAQQPKPHARGSGPRNESRGSTLGGHKDLVVQELADKAQVDLDTFDGQLRHHRSRGTTVESPEHGEQLAGQGDRVVVRVAANYDESFWIGRGGLD